jgi:hypothetical protein
LLPAVEFFDCGDGIWAQAAASWIRAPLEFPGALKSIRDYGTGVWLYYLGPFVMGFGAIGTNYWTRPGGERKEIGFIPQVGLCVDFHGQPRNASLKERFAGQIMLHLLTQAKNDGLSEVGLLVDVENGRAIRFFEKVGFVQQSTREQRYGRMFVKMFVGI